MFKLSAVFVVLALLASGSQAQTLISVRGTVAGDSIITISGSSFGDGPHVVIFDDFSRGAVGDPITAEATVGQWTLVSGTYGGDLTGNRCADLVADDSVRRLKLGFPPSQEVFLSYNLMVPRGKRFPAGAAIDSLGGTNFKIVWLFDDYINGVSTNGSDGYGVNDNVVTPFADRNMFRYTSNDVGFSTSNFGEWRHSNNSDRFFRMFGERNRWACWMKGGVEDPTDSDGYIWSQGMSEFYGQKIKDGTGTVFVPTNENDVDSVPRWTWINIPGYVDGGGANGEGYAQYDNIYLAVGDNAAARIEMGNQRIYQECTKLDICTPVDWSESLIRATVRNSSFSADEPAFIFVVTGAGVFSEGYPVTVASDASSGLSAPIDPVWEP